VKEVATDAVGRTDGLLRDPSADRSGEGDREEAWKGATLQQPLERELIRKCKAGQSRFYEPLVRAYEGSGLRLAVAMMGNMEDAKDALQMAFIKTYDTLPRFDLRRPFGPWFFQILRNQCRDMLRTRKAKFQVEALDEHVEDHPADHEGGPERAHQRSTARELLWKGLERIGEEHREILVLKELEGFRYTEIAQILEIPEGTVASRLYHARAALKDALVGMGAEYPS
jgi:RNA polymerase sigma-70 factor (ECF subfamily)